MNIIGSFFSAIFLFNAIPHLVQGICGRRHMTPFSPESSAAVNVIWGWINLVIGALLAHISYSHEWSLGSCIAFCVGGFSVSIYLAIFWSNPDARLPWHRK
jgi:hypothetical protein